MNPSIRHLLVLSVTAAACLQQAQAQSYGTPVAPVYSQANVAVSQQEMDAILAPIALYPDSLLAQILMAATYPLEVSEAAQWSRAIPNVPPQEALRSVANRMWDPSVKSLIAFAQILDMMDRAPDWTRRLGDAFLAQQGQVWDTVQTLRRRAVATGQLRSNDTIRVLYNGATIVIDTAQPDVVYVPYYDPLYVYGTWWWPGYAPMRWNPWPGYVVHPGRARGYYTGPAFHVGNGFFFGQVDWFNHRVNLLPPPAWHRRPDERPGQPGWNTGHAWEHDPQHRGPEPRETPRRFVPPVPAPKPEAPRHEPPNRPDPRNHEPAPAPVRRGTERVERNYQPGQAPAVVAPAQIAPVPSAPAPLPSPRILRQPEPVQNAAPKVAPPAPPAPPPPVAPRAPEPEPRRTVGREIGARAE